MDLDAILGREAELLFEEEQGMKKRLEEQRRTLKNASRATWQENLIVVCGDAEERKRWASTLERDVTEQKQIKRIGVSPVYVQGPGKPEALLLARLLVKSAMKCGVTLSKKMLTDLEKSSLSAKYAELCQKENKL